MSDTVPTAQDFNTIKNLQINYPDAHIITYQYKPLAGITRINDPSGKIRQFVYDDLGRLRLEKNTEDEKTAEYEYRLAKYSNSNGSPVLTPPLITSFQHYHDQVPFILNSRINNFYIDIISGSGNYKCKWKINATDADSGVTTEYEHPSFIVNNNSISLSIPAGTNRGRASVTCNVSDTGSNEQRTEYFWFYYSIQ